MNAQGLPEPERPEAASRPAFQFSLFQLFVVITVLGFLCMLSLPAIHAAREASRRNACLNNMRRLGMAVVNYESAYGRYPVVSSAEGLLSKIPPGTVGWDATDSSGYSLFVAMLPYMEEKTLYQDIRSRSSGFTAPAFSARLVRSGDKKHFATVDMPSLRCPAFRGDRFVDVTVATEYAVLSQQSDAPAIGNYVALVGTHVDPSGRPVENGTIISRCEQDPANCFGRGRTVREIKDGTAKTLAMCETREPAYGAWYDGQTAWVVGLDSTSFVEPNPTTGFLEAENHLLNVGRTNKPSSVAYSDLGLLGAKGWPGAAPRDWGPSSQHPGDVVMHTFVDGHTQAISIEIDATLYGQIITRDGSEPMTSCGI